MKCEECGKNGIYPKVTQGMHFAKTHDILAYYKGKLICKECFVWKHCG
jgi:hypothetical protein